MRQQITQVHNVSSEDFKNEIVAEIAAKMKAELQLVAENFKPKLQTEYITVSEVAKILRVSSKTIYDWRKQGILIAYRIGNKVRFKKHEIENSLKLIKN